MEAGFSVSDTIRELRELLDGLREPLPWRIEREDTTGEEPNGWIYPHGAYSSTPGVNELIVAAVNALPALLAIAEAAGTYVRVIGADSGIEEYAPAWNSLRDALAKLNEATA